MITGSKVLEFTARRRPPNAGKGRKAGVPNKLTREVKGMILAALDEAGGVAYLRRQADENPTAFLSLLGKVLPLQVSAPNDAASMPVQFIIQPVRPAGYDDASDGRQ